MAVMKTTGRYAVGWTDPRGTLGGNMAMAGMGASPYYGEMYRIDEDVNKLERYAELSGDKVIRIDLKETPEMEIDPRIVILKAAGQGKYVKEVGIMIDNERYALYEET
jgi:hypothetical protein